MDASLTFWIILFCLIVILPFAGWLAYRCLNWRAWFGYQEPEGNQFADACAANPWRRG